ncbi:Transmembrane amino acid transporter protein [Phytophthora infestans]|uniref:Transmembrane amino acid transporter protein n=2 Tax=Phytophthora infestans TaxID=4787 RepID=A0A8S9UKC1_PHYIN|nr:Transmembrane amino acid transporter protein [Phytophthora infestans]
MAGGGPSIGSYSPLTGFVFIFNLIVGAGALTIPHAFANVGLIYGSIALSILASVSYVTATFMVEAIAGVNALKRRARELGVDAANGDEKQPMNELSDSDDGDAHTEFVPLMVASEKHDVLERKLRAKTSEIRFHFDLSKKMELAEMAELLFNHRGIVAFYACITVYLYGDLAIYAVAVPKSLREIICPRPSADAVVWECSDKFNSSDLYRLFVVLFGLLLGPFTFGHVHKTRTLQLVSTIIRHASFGLMIVLAIIGISRGHGRSVADVVSYEKPANIATFFGVCIYSFMCHHSVPGLVAPITDKSKVGTVLASAFMAVLSVYFVLCASATFRFQPEDVDDVYTLNFKNYPVQAFGYFLSLFPVFTLSASFPLICITLRENIRHLATNMNGSSAPSDAAFPSRGLYGFLETNMYALVALLPPLVVAFFTEDVSMLVGFTGAYAGLGIQWIVPTFLVFCLRRRLATEWKQMHPMEVAVTRPGPPAARGNKNRFASPFAHQSWLYMVLAFSVVSVVLITITHGMH